MTPEQRGDFDLLVDQYRGKDDWRPSSTIIRIDTILAVDAELRDLRAALAASQAREAALTELLRATWKIANLFCRRQLLLADVVEPILAGQSPDTVADALGRVARASVAWSAWYAQMIDGVQDPVTAESDTVLKAAVEELLAVAPHWGEPREETNRGER